MLRTYATSLLLLLLCVQAWATNYVSNANGNWSTTTIWTPNGTPGDGDKVTINHNITVDSNRTIGEGPPTTPTTAPTIADTGAATTNLPTGSYRLTYAGVDAGGKISSVFRSASGFSTGTLTNGTSRPRVTLPALPTGVSSWNVYLSQAAGASGTERLYATGITGTIDLISASYMDGTDTYANATQIVAGAAITVATAAKTLTVADGVTMTVKGDIDTVASGSTIADSVIFSFGAGGGLTWFPPNSQRYVARVMFGRTHYLFRFNGTSGSPCTVQTNTSSGGLACSFNANGSTMYAGVQTASYTNFVDVASTTGGVAIYLGSGTPFQEVSFANCTFTRCNFVQSDVTSSGTWDGNFTFTGNTFSSSVDFTHSGNANCCAGFSFAGEGTNGVWLIDQVGFDRNIGLVTYRTRLKIDRTVLRRAMSLGGSWTAGQFSRVFMFGLGTSGGNTLRGPIDKLYLYQGLDGTHYVGGIGTSATDCVIEPRTEESTGDGLIIPTTGDFLATGNLVLHKGGHGVKLVSALGKSNGVITAHHNTAIGSTEAGLVALGESATSYAGECGSCRSNLVVRLTAGGSGVFAVQDGDSTVNAVTLGSHNAYLNANTSTCHYNTSTAQAGVLGANTIRVSQNDDFPNSNFGENDITLTGDPFVDSTRNLGTWGALKGTDGSESAAIDWAIAHPAETWDDTTGLWAWVRAGYKVTGPQGLLLRNAGHDGVTIGAMEFQAAAGAAAIQLILDCDDQCTEPCYSLAP